MNRSRIPDFPGFNYPESLMHKKFLPRLAAATAAVALFLLAGAAALAQTASPVPGASPAPAVEQVNLLKRIREGGWVMVPIGLCSVLTVFLIGDGYARTSPKRVAPAGQIAAVKDLFRNGDYVGAYNYCKANPSAATNVLRVGVSYLGDGKSMTETAMSEELAKENAGVQTRLSYLSVIGVCTPMIGLLGTVTGMMGAFSTLKTSGIGDPGALAGSIGEVLVATASGLFIAIPAFGAFYYLRNRGAAALHIIEDTANSLFRKMPYEHLIGVHIGDEELYAAVPNWIAASHGHDTGVNAPDVDAGHTVTAQAPIA